MDQSTPKDLSKDLWRFIIVGSFLFSICCVLVQNNLGIERLPFRYYLLAAAMSLVIEAILYFTIRTWSARSKTRVIWLIAIIWLGVCLFYGRL